MATHSSDFSGPFVSAHPCHHLMMMLLLSPREIFADQGYILRRAQAEYAPDDGHLGEVTSTRFHRYHSRCHPPCGCPRAHSSAVSPSKMRRAWMISSHASLRYRHRHGARPISRREPFWRRH